MAFKRVEEGGCEFGGCGAGAAVCKSESSRTEGGVYEGLKADL